MNFIFTLILIVSTGILVVTNPEGVMSAMLQGGKSAISFSLELVAIYAVWLSVLKIWESLKLDKGISKLLDKPIRALFPNEESETYAYLSLNLSANLLGMGGAGTPMGIKSVETMKSKKNKTMLLVINATSIQLIPTTVLGIRAGLGAAADIILPSLITTAITTVIGVILVKVLVR